MSITPGDVSSIYDPAPHEPPAGDWQDDDGQALDDYFKAGPQGPINWTLVQALKDAIAPPIASRMLRGRLYIPSGNPQAAIMALPTDPNRTYFRINEYNNNGFYMNSESFTVNDTAIPTASNTIGSTNAFYAAQVAGGSSPNPSVFLELYGYTGPVWVAGRPESSKPVLLEYLALTS